MYKTDMDIVDRQCVSIEFANGSIATLNLMGGTSVAGRPFLINSRKEILECYMTNR